MTSRRHLLASIVVVGLLAACSSSSTSTPSTTTTQPAPTTTVRTDDGRLVLGVITPRGGTTADLGTSMRAAVQLAVTQINAAGGVNGQPVTTILRDEGDNPASAAQAVQDLLQAGVDAIIGPTSSINVLGTLATAVRSGVLTCSPTASALALDSFPDDGLFIRTVASDSLQAQAIAKTVEETGNSQAAVVYLDDGYGRPFAQAVGRGLQANSTSVALTTGFDGSEASIQRTVAAVTKLAPAVVVVVADGSTGPTIISAIDAASGDSPPIYVVNDAIRRPASQAAPFSGSLATRVIGVSPEAYPPSDFLTKLHTIDARTTGLYSVNAYDCANVIALAAASSGSMNGSIMASAVSAVTSLGTECLDFTSCQVAIAAGRNIDYSGPTGALSIDANGDVSNAMFDRFGFDSNGRDHTTGSIDVGSG